MGCKDGTIHEIRIPRTEEIDNSETYLTEFKARTYTIKMMESQKPKKEEMDLEFLLRRNKDEKIPEVEWDPAPILNLCYFDNDCTRVICAVDGKFLGYLYVIDFNKERPIDALIVPKLQTQFLSFQENNDLLVIGFKNGSF